MASWPDNTALSTLNFDNDSDTVTGASGARNDLLNLIIKINAILAAVTTGADIWHTSNDNDLARLSLDNEFTDANGVRRSHASNPDFYLNQMGGGTDQKKWSLRANSEKLMLSIHDDAEANTKDIMLLDRSGTGAGITADLVNWVVTAFQINGVNVATETYVAAAIAASTSTDSIDDGNTEFTDGASEWTLSDPSVVVDATEFWGTPQSLKIPTGESATTPHILLDDGRFALKSILLTLAIKSSATTNAWNLVAKFYNSSDVYITGEDMTLANVTAGNAGTHWKDDSCTFYPPLDARYVEYVFTATTGTLWIDSITNIWNHFTTKSAYQGSTGVTAGSDFPIIDSEKRLTKDGNFVQVFNVDEVTVSGTVTISFDLSRSGLVAAVRGQIYRNGSAVGTLRSTTSTTPVNFSQDIGGWTIGDCLQIGVTGDTDPKSGSSTGIVENIKLMISGDVVVTPLINNLEASDRNVSGCS